MARLPVLLIAAATVIACSADKPAGNDGADAPAVPQTPPTQTVFVERAIETGLEFSHFVGATGEYFFPEIMGSGVALIDYDLDGDLDVYAVQSAQLGDPQAGLLFAEPDSHWPGNRLYRNGLVPDGTLSFTDVTDGSGAGDTGYGMGVAVGDVDNDGDPDMYVTNYGADVLLVNAGDGTFRDVTAEAGIDDTGWGTSASFFDYDLDGDLDLFVANYVTFTLTNNVRCSSASGQRDYCDPTTYRPMRDRLWENDGNGRFRDVSDEVGLDAAYGNGLGVATADLDGNGWPDVYVANDKLANQLWINDGEGAFADTALMSGSAYNADGLAEAGMGVTAGDVDGDGDDDLFMTHLKSQTNTLYLNDGAGNFTDDTDRFQLGLSSLRYTGFGTAWFDYDNDGLPDLFVANGAVIVESDQFGSDPYPYRQQNQLFRNVDGKGFVDVTAASGEAMTVSLVSRGAAFGDIDNDGDTDVVVSNNNGPLRLLLNEIGNDNNWLRLRLVGSDAPRDGTGAMVALVRADGSTLWRRTHTDGSYLSASDGRVLFGLGGEPAYEAVGVVWPGGQRERWPADGANRELTLVQGEGSPWP